MATFGDLKTRVSKRVGLSTTASGNDDVLLGEYLNDAVRDVLIKTKVNTDRATISISTETDDSEMSTNVLQLITLTVTGGSDARITQPVQVDADTILRYRSVTPSTGVTTRLFALLGDNLFMWYPSLASGDTVTVYYVPKPTEMTTSGNDPSSATYGGIPVQYHPLLEEYAAWHMWEYDDNPQRARICEERYLRMLVEMRRAMRGQASESLGKIPSIGRLNTFPANPSTDMGW